MDYRINPIVTQAPISRNQNSKLSFKKSYEAAVITPSNTVFIQNSSSNTEDGTTSTISTLTKSIERARRNLVEVMPLLDPVNSYKAIREETRSSKSDKKANSKPLNYEA